VAPVFPHTHRGADDLSAADVVEQPGDVSAALVAVFARPDLAALLDSTRVAAVGHSEGAITTLGIFDGCCRDPRVSAAVVLAGNTLGFREEFTGDPAPILFVHGDADGLVPYVSGRLAFDTDPWPKAFLTIAGGDHLGPYVTVDAPDFSRVAAATVEFLRWALLGDTDALAILRAAESDALDDQLG
jgi:pimeloyl-ACP methyl ester carboxylesterase